MAITLTVKNRVVILGAGASRSVSYALSREFQSPLDSDFFDLLQRRHAHPSSVTRRESLGRVLARMKALPTEYWRSLERAFYTLQMHAYLAQMLGDTEPEDTAENIISDFATSVTALLRSAHGTEICKHHQKLLGRLRKGDTILTFNYDLVAERALRSKCEKEGIKFGDWLYGFRPSGLRAPSLALLKLHGSSNWEYPGEKSLIKNFRVRTKAWEDFDDAPGYRGDTGEGTKFPIFLPFWDKRIEEGPWLKIWRNAHKRLLAATDVVVWGYSLPPTDIKAQRLFALTLGSKNRFNLAVVDPEQTIRARWRELFPNALYWPYANIDDFHKHPPKWWGESED